MKREETGMSGWLWWNKCCGGTSCMRQSCGRFVLRDRQIILLEEDVRDCMELVDRETCVWDMSS